MSGSLRCGGVVQLLQGEEGLVVRRVDREDLLVGRRGAVLVADLVLPERGDLEVLADLLARRPRRPRRAAS